MKILILDIETKPATAYVWRLFKENIGIEQIIDPGGIICVGAKWFGERALTFFSEWEHDHVGMLKGIHAMMSDADAVITYNGDRFDIPKLMGEFAVYGLPAPPPITSIDVYKVVKKLGFVSNRLGFIGPLMKSGQKVKHEGFELWAKVIAGDERAQLRMTRYCLHDVRLLDRVYKKLRPFIMNHPHMGEVKGNACGACGSHRVQSRGWRRTKNFRIQRLHCQDCGSWQDGKREKVT